MEHKELEEATVEYAATGEILPNGKELIDFQEEKAFRAGAQWQKEHVWHEASERPKKNRVKTAWITKKGTMYTGWYDKDAFDHERMQGAMLNFDFDEIDKWAYLSDILPK